MQILSDIPVELPGSEVTLRYDKTVPGDPDRGFVPFYHFKVIDRHGSTVGHINFKVGDTRHIILTAGHIGYEILPEFRGRAYSYDACTALAPFIRRHYERIIITVDPENTPSRRIIEKLGATMLDEVDVPADDPAYEKGARRKIRFEWYP